MNKQKSKDALHITQYHHFNRATDDKVNHSSHYLIYKITLGELFWGVGVGIKRRHHQLYFRLGKLENHLKFLKSVCTNKVRFRRMVEAESHLNPVHYLNIVTQKSIMQIKTT